ncbi:exonuclease domain-containing protein [Pengzhenrongella sicca]|uniref:DNA polymerase III subunit epsilon n=1 Tax=Pengzhenrongella sicca TaxID=2819238 RepID=A0A8A4ZDC7_9MICO|nr:exonuclease domain-containing protein [Pengzhenrongella sicca]QTE29914.1 DNA polymerase III subunit epsilon [Pengzhenrongella sicca]
MTWIDGPLLGFDTETTGVDVHTDRIVSAALVRRDGAGPGQRRTVIRTWLLDPGIEIPAAASAIHGITTERARAEGEPAALALEEMATAIAAASRVGVPVVAYNAAFDLEILAAELRRHALPTVADRLGRDVAPVIDPLVLDRAEDRYRRGKRRLGDLCGVYGVSQAGDLHSADVDVVATLDVLAAIVARYPGLDAVGLDRLHAYQVIAHRAWAEGFNAWRVSQGFEGPGAELAWPSRLPAGPVNLRAPADVAEPLNAAAPSAAPATAATPAPQREL